MTWSATTRKPASSPKELKDSLLYHGEGRKPAKVKAQYDAATKAAGQLLSTFDNPCHVALSGSVAGPQHEPERLHIEMGEA